MLIFDELRLLSTLQSGSPVFIPTDTLPALAIEPKYAYKIWDIKKRPSNKPLILMGANSNQLFKNVFSKALDDAKKIACAYWPGPLTIILPCQGIEARALNPFGTTLGMRVPSCQLARKFLEQSGPLATTSANYSGDAAFTNPKDLASSFPEIPILGPLPWPKASGIASTVIQWKGHSHWEVLRGGEMSAINYSDL